MKELELTMRLKNNLLKARRLALGMSPRQIADAASISYVTYLKYEALTQSPLGKHGDWRPSAQRIAAFHKSLPEDLWPDIVLKIKQPTVVAEIEAERALALARYTAAPELAAPSPSDLMDEYELVGIMDKVLVAALTPREEWVIRQRFMEDRGLQEIGDHLGVNRERVRQIEAKALRKLRHPKKAKQLVEFAIDKDILQYDRFSAIIAIAKKRGVYSLRASSESGVHIKSDKFQAFVGMRADLVDKGWDIHVYLDSEK